MKKVLSCILAMITCLVVFSACNNTSESEAKKNIEFVQKEIVLEIGQTVQLEVETTKKNVFVAYSVAEDTIATVSSDGLITGVKEGQTICYAELQGETVMCLIKVIKKQAKPMLSVSTPYQNDKIVMYVGSSIDLQCAVKMGDDVVSDAQKSYEVADEQILSVQNGKITALKVGETIVVITVASGDQTADVVLTVEVVEE